jgi:hypothetical protein
MWYPAVLFPKQKSRQSVDWRPLVLTSVTYFTSVVTFVDSEFPATSMDLTSIV